MSMIAIVGVRMWDCESLSVSMGMRLHRTELR